jgi:hypothetical protein
LPREKFPGVAQKLFGKRDDFDSRNERSVAQRVTPDAAWVDPATRYYRRLAKRKQLTLGSRALLAPLFQAT